MSPRSLVAGALVLLALGATTSQAQTSGEIDYREGATLQPWSPPATRASDLDVEVTGSTLPRETGALAPPASTRVTIDRPGCETQSYVVGSGSRVRVHRC